MIAGEGVSHVRHYGSFRGQRLKLGPPRRCGDAPYLLFGPEWLAAAGEPQDLPTVLAAALSRLPMPRTVVRSAVTGYSVAHLAERTERALNGPLGGPGQ